MFKTLLYVAIGGGLGSVLRYLTTIFVAKFWNNLFPMATFLTNIVGCFLIGLIVGYLQKSQMMDSNLKWFLVTGICGGYTTFSTFGLENQTFLSSQQFFISLVYMVTSVLIGILAVGFGLFVTKL